MTLIPAILYSVYLMFSSRKYIIGEKKLNELPIISVIIPAYNEEEVLREKIRNLYEINYPREKMEVIVADDKSTDNTMCMAKEELRRYGLRGKVISNVRRSGTNHGLNKGVADATNKIIVSTDADVIFKEDALEHLIKVLLSSKDIGAVCGELVPWAERDSYSYKTETSYRNIYGKICAWESHLGSSYCFNGQLMAFRKEAFSPIPNDAETGASLAFSVIRNGYKALYVSTAKFYEKIPLSIKEQRRQKIRRSTRILRATLSNVDLVGKGGMFGKVIYPLRFLMFAVAPTLIFIAIALWTLFLAQWNPPYALFVPLMIGITLLSGKFRSNLFTSFLWHQAYLVLGLMGMYRDTQTWKPVNRR